jgi:hypothetical protein
MPDQQQESDLLHTFKNHLAIIVGFCDLLLNEMSEDDSKRADIVEVHKAAEAAMSLMPELARRIR